MACDLLCGFVCVIQFLFVSYIFRATTFIASTASVKPYTLIKVPSKVNFNMLYTGVIFIIVSYFGIYFKFGAVNVLKLV